MAVRLDPRWPSLRDTPGGFPESPNIEPHAGLISAPHSLSLAVKSRKSEYIRKHTIKIKIGTWNVAAISGTEKDLGAWFVEGKGVKGLSQDLASLSIEGGSEDKVAENYIESVADQEARKVSKKMKSTPHNDVPAVPGGKEIGLYVLGLQEIVDINSATETIRQFTDTHTPKKWRNAMEAALPRGYKLVAEQQLIGLYLLIYASPEVAPTIGSVSTTSVGTGLMGYLGNKGAVSARLILGQTTSLLFINVHLAAGADQASLDRRNADYQQILNRTRFGPVSDPEVAEEFGDAIGNEDFAFIFGDLNYRLEDMPGEDVRRLLLLHTRNEYDVNNKSKRKIDSELGYIAPPVESFSTVGADDPENSPPLDPKSDPASLHTTLRSLLQHDQLRRQQKLGKALHDGWHEGEINFLPTYKYDIGSVGMFDSGEKKRAPSWCDRILYRSRSHYAAYQKRAKAREDANKKDAEMKARGLDKAASEDAVLFDYNPKSDGLNYGEEYDEFEDASHTTHASHTNQGVEEDAEDALVLDHYISHQRVLSSDHKPLDAVFTLTYDVVEPELKAKVHQEVARELDRAENENRPDVTLVVDYHSEDATPNADNIAAERTLVDGIDFGEVRYDVPKSRGLTIANSGQVPATFFFVDRPGSTDQHSATAPSWLDLQVEWEGETTAQDETSGMSKKYTLRPGETATVTLTVNISDFDLVHDLNKGSMSIIDILVLRVSDGRDHFISIRGTWMPSAFCRAVDELVLVPEGGVRTLLTVELQTSREPAVDEGERPTVSGRDIRRISASREILALTQSISSLVETSTAEGDMMEEGRTARWKMEGIGAGWPFDNQAWIFPHGPERSQLLACTREALDTSGPFQAHLPPDTPSIIRLEVLAETLLDFLKSLRDGIITTSLWTDMDSQISALERAKGQIAYHEMQSLVLDTLSSVPVHSIAFTFLTFMLVRVLDAMAPSLSATGTPSYAHPTPSRASEESSTSQTPETSIDRSWSRSRIFQSSRRRNRSSTASDNVKEASSMTAISIDPRKLREHSLAKIFAGVIIRSQSIQPMKEKDRKATEDRKVRVIEAFLQP